MPGKQKCPVDRTSMGRLRKKVLDFEAEMDIKCAQFDRDITRAMEDDNFRLAYNRLSRRENRIRLGGPEQIYYNEGYLYALKMYGIITTKQMNLLLKKFGFASREYE